MNSITTETASTAPLPCPFCGAPAQQSTGGNGDSQWFGTGCKRSLSCPAHLHALTHRSQAAADAAWNNRACDTPNYCRSAQRCTAQDEVQTTPTQHRDRTPQDFAIEFAEYMAKGAEALITAINADAEVRLRIAESDDVSDDDEHDAQATVSEMQRALQSDIYEFRKRRDRAASTPSPAPAVGVPLPMTGDEDESELSDWQPGGTKPMLEGAYLREFDEGSGTSEFNAGVWLRDGFFPSDIQNARWRGRAQPAAAGITAGWRDGVSAVAKMLKDKADAYAAEFGHDDMGGLSFGTGNHGAAKLEYHSGLIELEEEVRAMLATAPLASGVVEYAARYQLVRRGQHWSVVDGAGNDLRGEALDAAVDSVLTKKGGLA